MSYFDQREDSILLMDESLLNLYDEQFEYSSFKSLISKKYNQSNIFMNHLFDSIEQDDDVNLVVDLSDELKEKYKKGLLRFDKDKNSNMYAQLRDEKNHYGKKLNIKEQVNEKDFIASQLNVIKDVLDDIVDTLENIEENISHILMEFHNDRVGLYYSGLSLYLEALQVSDASLRNELISQSLKSLNDSQAQIIQELKSDIAFLRSPQFNKIKRKKETRLSCRENAEHSCLFSDDQ